MKDSFITDTIDDDLENILKKEIDETRLLIDIDSEENFNSFDDNTCNILDKDLLNRSLTRDQLPIAELKY